MRFCGWGVGSQGEAETLQEHLLFYLRKLVGAQIVYCYFRGWSQQWSKKCCGGLCCDGGVSCSGLVWVEWVLVFWRL